MNKEKYILFYELLHKKGSDFTDILKSPELSGFTVKDLEEAYRKIIENIGCICEENGGYNDIKQIKDIYRVNGEVHFDVIEENNILKENKKMDIYSSKFFILLKDYEYFLRGKLNMINEKIKNFKISDEENEEA